MNKKAITFSSDSKYMNYTINLLKSIEKNCRGIDVFYRGVNITDDDINKILDFDVVWMLDEINLSTKKNLIKSSDNQFIIKDKPVISQLLYSEAIAYTCHSRFKNINYILGKGYDTILALDADSYINKNIDCLFEDYKNFDLCTVVENNNYFENEGLLLINRNDRTIGYFKEIENYLFEKGNYKDWDSDGYILNKLYKKYNINIGPLSPLFKHPPHEDAYIWSGDGEVKHESSIIR